MQKHGYVGLEPPILGGHGANRESTLPASELGGGDWHWKVQRTIDNYHRVIDYASEKGVTLVLEVVHDHWCATCQVAAVVEGVNSDYLKVNGDIRHSQCFAERSEVSDMDIGALTTHVHWSAGN